MQVGGILGDSALVTCDGEPRRGMTGAQRQARYRSRLRRGGGVVAVTVMIPASAITDFQLAAEALREATHLSLGPLRDPVSGKLVSAKSVLHRKAGSK